MSHKKRNKITSIKHVPVINIIFSQISTHAFLSEKIDTRARKSYTSTVPDRKEY